MIVIPQLFNYRLIIGTLVIAFVVLGSYSFSSYNTLKNHEQFLEQEKHLVQKELSEMIALYDKVAVENEKLSGELQQSKSNAQSVLDSLIAAKTNFPLVTRLKSQVQALKREKEVLFNKIHELNLQNEALSDKVFVVSEKIEIQQAYIASLELKNHSLTETLKEAQALSALEIRAKALNTISSQNISETERADRTDHVEVCFTILKNNLTPQGNKDIYVQILDPNNNVVADRGVAHFGESSLIYTGKTAVNYTNNDLEICTKMNVNTQEPLVEGSYLVNVFHKDQKLGSTKIVLN